MSRPYTEFEIQWDMASSCLSKKQHQTRRIANLYMQRMGSLAKGKIVYACDYCDGFHIGQRAFPKATVQPRFSCVE